MAKDPDLARRAHQLRDVVAGLGQSIAATPPADLRATVLQRAADSPRAPMAGTPAIDLFADQVQSLHDMVATLAASDWRQRAAPYAWTVHELVAHLLVIERYTAAQLGLANGQEHDGEIDHLTMGAELIAAERNRPPELTVAAWHETATTTIRALQDGAGPAPDAAVELHGWPFDVTSLLVARAFEVWTHTDDIRRAGGRPLAAPPAADLRTMSKFSVRSLPLVAPLVQAEATFEGARIVLTGDGGGTFDLGDPDRRETLLVVDVEDYCRHAARRIPLERLTVTIEGDRATASRLLAASRVFAV